MSLLRYGRLDESMQWGWSGVKIKNFGHVKFKSINIPRRVLEETGGWDLGEKSGLKI